MPDPSPPRARWAYDETLVLADGREIAVRSIGDVIVVLRIADRDDVALAPHEARQIASLLRNGTELDYLPHRSCDEALEAARKERDTAIDECARMRRELEVLQEELRHTPSADSPIAVRLDAILRGGES